jgi:hypothetical protein
VTNTEKSSWMGDTFLVLGLLGIVEILTRKGLDESTSCRKKNAGFQTCMNFDRFSCENQGVGVNLNICIFSEGCVF